MAVPVVTPTQLWPGEGRSSGSRGRPGWRWLPAASSLPRCFSAAACGVAWQQAYVKRSICGLTGLNLKWWQRLIVPYPRHDDPDVRELLKAIKDEPGTFPS